MKKTKRRPPGPAPTGLSRTIPLPLMFNADEWEYLCRLEKEYAEKKAAIIRYRVFVSNWRQQLEAMRATQGANLK